MTLQLRNHLKFLPTLLRFAFRGLPPSVWVQLASTTLHESSLFDSTAMFQIWITTSWSPFPGLQLLKYLGASQVEARALPGAGGLGRRSQVWCKPSNIYLMIQLTVSSNCSLYISYITIYHNHITWWLDSKGLLLDRIHQFGRIPFSTKIWLQNKGVALSSVQGNIDEYCMHSIWQMTASLDRSSQSPCLVMQSQGSEPITQKVSQSFFCIGRNLQFPSEGFDDLNLQFEFIFSALPSGLLQARRSFGRHHLRDCIGWVASAALICAWSQAGETWERKLSSPLPMPQIQHGTAAFFGMPHWFQRRELSCFQSLANNPIRDAKLRSPGVRPSLTASWSGSSAKEPNEMLSKIIIRRPESAWLGNILCRIQTVSMGTKSKIQNPKSEIQNPKSKIQNPKSEIQNPKSKIQNPKSEIRNPKSKIQTGPFGAATKRTKTKLIQNPKSKIRNPKSKIQNPKSEIQNPKSKIQNPKSKIQNPKSEIQNPKSKIRNPKSKIQNPKSKIQNPKSKIQNPNGPFGFWILDFGRAGTGGDGHVANEDVWPCWPPEFGLVGGAQACNRKVAGSIPPTSGPNWAPISGGGVLPEIGARFPGPCSGNWGPISGETASQEALFETLG